jgi:hypothetical protein
MNKKEVSDIMGSFIYLFLNRDMLNIFYKHKYMSFQNTNVFFLYLSFHAVFHYLEKKERNLQTNKKNGN